MKRKFYLTEVARYVTIEITIRLVHGFNMGYATVSTGVQTGAAQFLVTSFFSIPNPIPPATVTHIDWIAVFDVLSYNFAPWKKIQLVDRFRLGEFAILLGSVPITHGYLTTETQYFGHYGSYQPWNNKPFVQGISQLPFVPSDYYLLSVKADSVAIMPDKSVGTWQLTMSCAWDETFDNQSWF